MEANNLGIRIEDNVLKGKDVPYTANYTNLGKVVLDILENNEDFVGLVDPVTDEKYDYRTMRERSVRCALWMKAQGLQPGDVVSTCSDNLDTRLLCFATLYIGAVFNPLDPDIKPKDLSHLLNIIKPKMVFTNEKSATTIAGAAEGAKLDVKIIVFGRVPGFFEYETVIAGPTDEEVKNFRVDRIGSPDETVVILCSSGTTGLPKGVALSHKTYVENSTSLEVPKFTGMTCMVFTSICWITGTWMILGCLFRKLINVISPPFEEYSACEIIEKYKVNCIILPPNMINRWLQSDALGKYDLSSIRIVAVGGSHLNVASQEAFTKHLQPDTFFTVGYAMTEVGCMIASTMPSTQRKPGSCGRIMDNVQLKVVDPVTSRVYGANKTGEFFVKTHTMMNGYCNNPKATADAVDEEGWMRTGDLGYYDENGDIFIVDRLKAMIKYRGYHASPAEIESVLLSHPGVKEAVVLGLPHPQDGELPIAFVVKITNPFGSGKQVTEQELIDLVASEMTDSKQLRGGVRFVDSLPKSPSGKVLRGKVREMVKSMVKM